MTHSLGVLLGGCTPSCTSVLLTFSNEYPSLVNPFQKPTLSTMEENLVNDLLIFSQLFQKMLDVMLELIYFKKRPSLFTFYFLFFLESSLKFLYGCTRIDYHTRTTVRHGGP
jgi:hypothetical protein